MAWRTTRRKILISTQVASDYGSTDLKDLEAIKPHKKEKRPPTSSLIVVLLQGVMQVGGFTAIIPTAAMYVGSQVRSLVLLRCPCMEALIQPGGPCKNCGLLQIRR